MKNNFNSIIFFPFRGYGTFIEKLMIKLLKNKKYILRDFSTRTILSEIGKESYDNYKDVYLETEAFLNDVYHKVENEDNYYNDINIPKVFKRELQLYFSEFFNKIFQLKQYQTENNTIYKAEYKLCKILKSKNIKCKVSFLLTVIYFILDISFIIFTKIKQKLNRSNFNSNIYIHKQNNQDKKMLLAVGVAKNRINKTFINLFDTINNNFNLNYIQPETDIEISNLSRYDKKVLKIGTIPSRSYKINYTNSANEIEKFAIKYLSSILERHNHKALSFINILQNVNNHNKIDAIITGMTFYWMYDICVQFAQKNNIKSIFFQDVFLYEDLFHNISSDYILTASKIFNYNECNYFNKDTNQIFLSKEINNFLTTSPLDLGIKSEEELKCIKLSLINTLKIDALDKKIILFASDPGNTVNSLEQKYIDEFNLLNTLSNSDDYFIIIKLHPSDNTEISEKALSDSKNKNAIVIKDIDFYDCLYSCDIFISKYSTSVLEAMLLNKFILLNNYDKASFYRKSVDYKVAHYINNVEDIKKSINKKDELMSGFKEKRDIYFDEIYVNNNDNKDINNILKEVVND